MRALYVLGLTFVAVLALGLVVSGCGKKTASPAPAPAAPGPAAGAAKAPAAAAQQYTCPMHPEVVQDKPGKCPKCGMDLVELKPGESPPSAAPASNLPVGNQKDAQGRYICPVSGDVVESISTAEHTEYQGKVYYFCCGDCPPKFKADPDKYLKGSAKPEGADEAKESH
jgi:YHS domain-containing protein